MAKKVSQKRNNKNKERLNKSDITSQHTCVYYKNKNGLGGVAVDLLTQEKILIEKTAENFALEGDEIEVCAWIDSLNVCYGRIQKIKTHNTRNLIGSIYFHKNKPLLQVTDPKFGNYLVKITAEIDLKVDKDELFNAVIINYPNRETPYFEATIHNSIGNIDDANTFITKCIIESNLPVEFSEAALKLAAQIPETIPHKEITTRRDLRDLCFVTIDGEDAKDFDDAVYCDFQDGVYTLFVAIADVAHYVTHNSSLDTDAYLRSTSVYFPRQVIPMLPEVLSNGICSLNPHVDRLVMSVEIQIDVTGNILNYQVDNSIINSKARLTYEQVEKWIDDLSTTPKPIINNISNLYLVFKNLLKARFARGAIDFESTEAKFEFDAQGMVTNIIPRIRLESHRLIEECMLAANVCIADFLIKHNHAGLFRVHDKPTPEKFIALKNYLHSLAIEFNVSYEQLTPHDYANLLIRLHEHPDFLTIQQATLRSMQLAVYSPNNIGHFGLNYPKYMHFTSPIRRYPDLLTHRACKSILLNTQYQTTYPLALMGEHTSFTERRAEDLERKTDAFYKCQFAKSHIGGQFEGIVTSVVNFGLFVYLPQLMLDGLVHIAELGEDYFIFDDKQQVIIGKHTGTAYRNGQIIQTQINSVDMARLFIDLTLV